MEARRILVALAVLAAGLAAASMVTAEEADVECDPYPIGRCGAFDREAVIFCYLPGKPLGVYVSGTEWNTVNLTTPAVPTPVGTPVSSEKTHAYVWRGPALAFAADPYESDLPFDSLWQETNSVSGLQTKPVKCGTFLWFAECIPQQWMGPFNISNRPADDVVV